jgi:hypothetical protein
MPPVTCPSCRNVQEVGEPPRYDHDEFCDRCHYPLFWAPRDTPPALSAVDSDLKATFRSPGVEGLSIDDAVVCPSCLERNVPGNTFCVRCSKDLPPA